MKMKVNKKDVSLEWSFSQGCFHIDSLERTMKSNISAFLRGGCTDYIILGIFENCKDASAAAQWLREERPDLFEEKLEVSDKDIEKYNNKPGVFMWVD